LSPRLTGVAAIERRRNTGSTEHENLGLQETCPPERREWHSAISSVQVMASRYATHVPFPAEAKTSGTVIAAEQVGAIVEIDCAKVSSGPKCGVADHILAGSRLQAEFAVSRWNAAN
jgi:hypothetical protein